MIVAPREVTLGLFVVVVIDSQHTLNNKPSTLLRTRSTPLPAPLWISRGDPDYIDPARREPSPGPRARASNPLHLALPNPDHLNSHILPPPSSQTERPTARLVHARHHKPCVVRCARHGAVLPRADSPGRGLRTRNRIRTRAFSESGAPGRRTPIMVNTGKPSPGCFACRKRRIKVSLLLPLRSQSRRCPVSLPRAAGADSLLV